jgi:hypothetical protein
MSPGRLPSGWRALALAAMLGACRGRTPAAPAVDWQPAAGASAEKAALLLLDKEGTAEVVCLPGPTRARRLFSEVSMQQILDVGWQAGPLFAGRASAAGGPEQGDGDELVLLAASGGPRRLARGVRTARFSPDATALAYQIVRPQDDGPASARPTSYVLELGTGKVTELGALADPLWEADGRHLRATRWRTASEEGREKAPQWTSLRVCWDRESGTTSSDGPGTAQVPAPVGEAVAWTEEQRTAIAASQCTVLLSRRGGVRHSVEGRFCRGIADDREVRWAPDGRWLAFPHSGRLPDQRHAGVFVNVVGVEGGRYPALIALQAKARPEQLTIATAPGSVWFDWSPTGRFLALHDGAGDLRVYDFEVRGVAALGKGQKPMWSPGGAYLLILAAGPAPAPGGGPRSLRTLEVTGSASAATVLTGSDPAARIGLGPVRDARWLPAQACERF